MKPSIAIAAALASAGLLTAGALWNGPLRVWGWVPPVFAAVWYALRRGRPWVGGLICAGLVVFAALGVLSGGSAWVALGAVLCGLAAWDLTDFERTALAQARVDDADAQFRSHARHLCIALGAGFALSAIALAVRISATFAVVVALFILAITLARFAIRAERRASNSGQVK
jgi:hypothetical protein